MAVTLVFSQEGLVDGWLGLILSAASFADAPFGAELARRVSNLWLRSILVVTVVAMALMTLFLDVHWTNF